MGKSVFYDSISYCKFPEMEWVTKKFEGKERSNHVALPIVPLDYYSGNISRFLMIHGGNKKKEYFGDVLWFDSLVDQFVNIYEDRLDNKPIARKYHACGYTYGYRKIIFFGGETEQGTVDNTVYILNVSEFYTNKVTWEKSILHRDSVVPPPLKFATISQHLYRNIFNIFFFFFLFIFLLFIF